jgi:hypothetical protein
MSKDDQPVSAAISRKVVNGKPECGENGWWISAFARSWTLFYDLDFASQTHAHASRSPSPPHLEHDAEPRDFISRLPSLIRPIQDSRRRGPLATSSRDRPHTPVYEEPIYLQPFQKASSSSIFPAVPAFTARIAPRDLLSCLRAQRTEQPMAASIVCEQTSAS